MYKKLDIGQLDIGTEPEQVVNPWSGESVLLEPLAVAVYDLIQGAYQVGDYELYGQAREYFLQEWPTAYMKLVD